MVITYSKSMDQPGKVANPARGQLNRENNIPLSPCVPENLVSRDGFSRPVPRQSTHLHTQAESGAYLRDSSRVSRRRPFMKPPYAIGSVPSLSGHIVALLDTVLYCSSTSTVYSYYSIIYCSLYQVILIASRTALLSIGCRFYVFYINMPRMTLGGTNNTVLSLISRFVAW